MSPPQLIAGFRALAFGALTSWLVLCLLEFWGALVGMEGTYGWAFDPDLFDYLACSPPDIVDHLHLITAGAGVIVSLLLLSTGRTPGWSWLAVTSLAVFLITACLRVGTRVAVRNTLYFGPYDVTIIHNRYPAVQIIAIECVVIFCLLLSWVDKSPSAVPASDGGSEEPGSATRRAGRRFPFKRVALISLTVILLAVGTLFLARSSFEKSVVSTEQHRAMRLEAITKTERPRVWLYAASDLVAAREAVGDYSGAAEILQEMLALKESLHGPESREVATQSLEVARALLRTQHPTDAEPWLRRYLTYVERNDVPRHITLDDALRTLANAFQDQGKFNEAKSVFEKRIAERVRLFGRDNKRKLPDRLVLPDTLVKEYRDLLTKMGETPEAIQKRLDTLTAPPAP